MLKPQIHYIFVQSLFVKLTPLPNHHINNILYLLFHAFFFGNPQIVEGLLHPWRVEVEVDFLQLLVVAYLLDIIALRLRLLLGGQCAQIKVGIRLTSSTSHCQCAIFPWLRLILS
jgi:hypothetical protein